MIAEKLKFYRDGLAGSYAQVFFSNDRRFAFLLILSSFVDPCTGFSGLLSALLALMVARWFGFSPALIRDGTYSYNSLLVGLAIGLYFKMNGPFFLILVLGSTLTLFLSVFMVAQLEKCRLPILSLPFLMGTWAVLLSTRSYGSMGLSERGVYAINELWRFGGEGLVAFYDKLSHWTILPAVAIYLKSLGAILFQYNEVSGLLIAAGLLLYSRIAFSLALVGFLTGLLFYYLVAGNFTELQYSYIGFNFILSAIALGGFFVIPSRRSYLLVILTTPLIGLIMSASGRLLWTYQLPLYSLPFNLIVLLTLYVLSQRSKTSKTLQPELVEVQQFSPEKNFYRHHNQKQRLSNDSYFHIHLPFFGAWYVSQGHDGNVTHCDDWRFAWDFVVTDEMRKTARPPGTSPSHFFSYNLPILAPAAGQVIEIIDDVPDNDIGMVSLAENWGNTIVIKHLDHLYSKLSHIRKGSFQVKPGDYVRKGDFIASCGNSGRSTEPHIHFQLQATPFVGSRTLQYPISYYLAAEKQSCRLRAFSYPRQGETISRLAVTPLLRQALCFIPGSTLHFEVTTTNGGSQRVLWEVLVDAFNQSYLFCHNTGSVAYFRNNETLHYFTDFFGDYNSLLYYFYLGAHSVLLGYYQDLELTDHLPLDNFYPGSLKLLQDFLCPFHVFLETSFRAVFTQIDDPDNPRSITVASESRALVANSIKGSMDFLLVFTDNRIHEFTVTEKGRTIMARRVEPS